MSLSDRIWTMLVEYARAAYGQPREPRECVLCGRTTDTVDGFPVEFPEGEVYVCAVCNLRDRTWRNGDEPNFDFHGRPLE